MLGLISAGPILASPGWEDQRGSGCGTRVSVADFKKCVDKYGITYEWADPLYHPPTVRTHYILNDLAQDAGSGTDKEKIEKFKYLLRKGADVNQIVWPGHSPLEMSLWNQETPAVSYFLIQHGAFIKDSKVTYNNSKTTTVSLVHKYHMNNRGLANFPKLLDVLTGAIKLTSTNKSKKFSNV